MRHDNQKITKELFPNFSSFDRAINYPYFAPNYSFSFYKGEFIKGICDNLNNRIPILSVGSNRSPYQLKRKFSLNQDICVTPAILIDSDIVYAASLSAYGSILGCTISVLILLFVFFSMIVVLDTYIYFEIRMGKHKNRNIKIMASLELLNHYAKFEQDWEIFVDPQWRNDLFNAKVRGLSTQTKFVKNQSQGIFTPIDNIEFIPYEELITEEGRNKLQFIDEDAYSRLLSVFEPKIGRIAIGVELP